MQVPISGTATLPDPATIPTPWTQFSCWYTDPAGAYRTITPGYNGGLWKATMPNEPQSSSFIRIEPPTSGTGVLRMRTSLKLLVDNRANLAHAVVKVCLGVTGPLNTTKPMYPYLGVQHAHGDVDPDEMAIVPAGGMAWVTDFRLDIVDNALESDQPIAGWPTWAMAKNAAGGFPAVCPWVSNLGLAPFIVRAVQAHSLVF